MILKFPESARPGAQPRTGGSGTALARPMTLAAALASALALAALAGCSSAAPETNAQASTARNVTLTAAQRASIHLLTVAPSSYHTRTTTTAVVDFDHDRSTPVLAPFSGR